ncbi:MAG: acyltransferase domain-containing protein [Rhodocyclaceae bacterium]|nr:acyltransferase domain-containing protein [Rhodocyclaceae bacterium]MCB1954103.1 acyltransferase domain-containing protein [Rhodocyclaceae bacterium]
MRLAILCSGQAGQHREMLDPVFDTPGCADLCEIASRVLGQPVERWWRSLDEGALFANANAQFAITLVQLANWQRVGPFLGRAPSVVAGYSLGEVVAWHVAGSLSATDTLSLVRERARLMDACVPPGPLGAGCMALWRGRTLPALREARTQAMARHGVSVAIHRPAGELVLGGAPRAMDAFVADAALAAADLKRLPVAVPSHTPALADAVERLRQALTRRPMTEPRVPVLAGIDGTLQRRAVDALRSLPRQVAEALHWDWCVETLAALGVDVAIELGPGNDLARQLEAQIPGSIARAVDEFAIAEDIAPWLDLHS